METNNLTFKQQLILMIAERSVSKYGTQELTDGNIARIREIADKLSEGFEDNAQLSIGISLDAKLRDYGIKHRSLQSNNIQTVGDLVQRTPFELLRLRNFGRGSLLEVEEFLNRYGLKLSGR